MTVDMARNRNEWKQSEQPGLEVGLEVGLKYTSSFRTYSITT
jgi:hypothetical protein